MPIKHNIILICDDNYCLPTAVCIQSIIDTITTNNETVVHICTFGLNEKNQQLLNNLSCEKVQIIIDFFYRENYEILLSRVNQKTHVSPSALIKFEIANYFTKLNKVLYLDSDIIIKKNITDLFNFDISGTYLAASFEFWSFLHYRSYTLKRDYNVDFNFNSGVMLLNLEKMRLDKVTEKLWDYKINRSKTPRMDQESFNAICGSTAIHLPIKWNFNPGFAKEEYVNHINAIYGEEYKSVEDMIEDVSVIHYVGKEDKPWVYSTARMKEYWNIAFKNTNIKMDLQQEAYVSQSVKLRDSIISKINLFGVKGVICYIINKLLKRI